MNKSKINVYSEYTKLKEVLVHTPGDEIRRISPNRLDELLFSAILEPNTAISEHKNFCKILKNNGVKVIQLTDLVAQTYKISSKKNRELFIERWLNESEPKLESRFRPIIKNYLSKIEKVSIKKMIKTMMAGIHKREINVECDRDLIIDPMPNLYFTRDPFASIGNGIALHHMKYVVRQRETLFSEFIFDNNPRYSSTPRFFNRDDIGKIEGGDVFVYNSKTLVIGVSERTNKEAINVIAKKIKENKEAKFEKIFAINVPAMPNLMHLDTWITMIDSNKFLYSPNMLSVLKVWEIDLKKEIIEWKEIDGSLQEILELIIGKKPILIPIAGHNASQLEIDIETHFDGSNYLAIAPSVVIGYSRNYLTEKALKKAKVKVLPLDGNQLSLGMGSARCMSMPLLREDIK
ncbi:arginine deiminase [Mycoplasma sp. U97]|uniref:arginine deiminase family protein n=1 Tax=Mycoplasma tauri TaxID=547987 RepID=UPI001CBF5FC1|nr:arginine deiminase family protein [Mycoplasma tauri]MBZ4212888.1 arginine deiminase [Mycoplasma tauri]